MRTGDAEWGLQLSGYGYSGTAAPVVAIPPQATRNRVVYKRSDLNEWYINGPLGLEQGFTLARPLQGRGQQELTIDLAFSGNLKAFENGDEVILRNEAGEPRLRYSGLEARDAENRELSSWLELRGQHLLLHVDDREARYPITVDPWVQTAELAASDGGTGDQFGWSVAISGNTVVVGAPFHTVGGNTSQGAAYVFVEPGSGWSNMTQTAELVASDGAANAFFGSSVAIYGNTIVVGAEGATVQGNAHQGSAYVFVEPGNGWTNMTESAELAAADGYVGDDFGEAIAISGATVVVGAPYAGVGSNAQQGAAYVFVQPQGGWSNIYQTAKLTSSDGAANDIFGTSVAAQGSTVVAGASGATINGNMNAGKAYVFVQPANGWSDMTQTAELTASDSAANNYFGSSVAVNGNTVVVGAPSDYTGAAYVFQQPAGGWVDSVQNAELTPAVVTSQLLLGTSVATDGGTVMTGAVGADAGGYDDAGGVYVFTLPITQTFGWVDANPSSQLSASDPGQGDYFGRAISVDNNMEAIGAPFHQVGSNLSQGVAYVFQPRNAKPNEKSLSPNTAVAGDPGFQLTVNGSRFVPGAVVTWNDSQRDTTYVSPNEVQAQVLASDIAKVGNYRVAVSNPAPGGGKSNNLTFTVENPAPEIGSLSPDQALAGGDAFTLTVNGSNFVSHSLVAWNGTQLSTTYVSSVKVTAHVPAKAIANAGTVNVTVVNPSPGGGTSNAAPFYISNPDPNLTQLHPSSVKAGSPAFTLSIDGSGFVGASQALWNGSPRTTTFVNTGKIQAKILASDVNNPGTAKVTVVNPAPGGGTSNALTFAINK